MLNINESVFRLEPLVNKHRPFLWATKCLSNDTLFPFYIGHLVRILNEEQLSILNDGLTVSGEMHRGSHKYVVYYSTFWHLSQGSPLQWLKWAFTKCCMSLFVLCTHAICRLCEYVTELGPSLKCSFNFVFSLTLRLPFVIQLPSRLGKESSGKRGRRSNGEEGKPRRKRGEPKVCELSFLFKLYVFDMHPKLPWFRYD